MNSLLIIAAGLVVIFGIVALAVVAAHFAAWFSEQLDRLFDK